MHKLSIRKTGGSSVAGGGGCSSPIGLSTKIQNKKGLSTKIQNKKNTTFLALLRLFFFLRWNGLKSDLKHLLKHIVRGGG